MALREETRALLLGGIEITFTILRLLKGEQMKEFFFSEPMEVV